MNNMHGIIFGFSEETGLGALTAERTAPSIPFGARYRIIDFILSTMTNAGITDIGVLLEKRYQSLLDHIGSGKDWDLSRKRGGIKLLPPFALVSGERIATNYYGYIDALDSVRSYVERIRQDYVVLADAMLIASFDLEKAFEQHLASGADITCVMTKNQQFVAPTVRFKLDESGRAVDIISGGKGSSCDCEYRGLGVHILSKELLLQLVDECITRGEHNFSTGALAARVDTLKIMGYTVEETAARLATTQDYYELNMKLLEADTRRELFPRERPVKTKVLDEAPTYYSPDSSVKNCIVADGCYIEGDVEDCVIFRGVKIAKGAKLKGCILMQATTVGEGAELDCVITDKDVTVTAGAKLVGQPNYPVIVSKGSTI